MKKEIIIVIIFGVAVGIAVAFGIWRANSALKTKLPDIPAILDKKSANETPQQIDLAIAKPEENDVITANPVSLAGITKPGSWIAISGETDDYIIQTDANGAFEQNVELKSGVNQIVVAAFDQSGEKNQKTVTVVYSTEFAKDIEAK